MEGYIPPEASHKCHTDTVILWILKNKTCALPAKHFWFQAAVGNICIASTSFTFFPTTVFQFKNIEILQSSATGSVSTVTRHWCRRTPVYCVAVMRVHSVEKGRLCWGWTSQPPSPHSHPHTESCFYHFRGLCITHLPLFIHSAVKAVLWHQYCDKPGVLWLWDEAPSHTVRYVCFLGISRHLIWKLWVAVSTFFINCNPLMNHLQVKTSNTKLPNGTRKLYSCHCHWEPSIAVIDASKPHTGGHPSSYPLIQ